MHESLAPADRLICAGVYWCGPKPILKPLSEIVSPGMEGLRAEWWLGEISQRCTRVLRLWWSGPGNYIRGTTRALVSVSLSLSVSLFLLWLFVNPLTLTMPHASLLVKCKEAPLKPYQTSSQGRELLYRPPFIMPCMVRQAREEDLWRGTSRARAPADNVLLLRVSVHSLLEAVI